MASTSPLLAKQPLNAALEGLIADYLDEIELADSGLLIQLAGIREAGTMSHAQWWQILADVQAALPDRAVGLEIGLSLRPKHLGTLGYLLIASKTPTELLNRFQRFLPLVHNTDKVDIAVDNGLIRLQWNQEFGGATRLGDEVYFSGILKFMRIATGQDSLGFNSLQLTYDKPPHAEAYTQLFKCPVEYGLDKLGFSMPIELLALPLQHADPDLAKILDEQARALLEALPHSSEFVETLRREIASSLQDGLVSADQIAQRLGCSRRTLHRKLTEVGIDFSGALKSVRSALAKTYLANQDLSLVDIALMLGYSDQSTFTRAFSSWTGTSPLQYRKAI